MIKDCVICGKEFYAKGAAITDTPECSRERKRQRTRARVREYRKKPEFLEGERSRERRYRKKPEYPERNRERSRRWYRNHTGVSVATQRFFLSLKLGEAANQKQTMKNEIEKTTPTVQKFIEAFISRLKGIEESCKELAVMVDANPNVFEEIIAADARFNYNMLESMRKVGKGELYCELLFDPSLAARKLLPLPVAQQRKLYNEPIQVVRNVGGKNTVESIPLQKLSRHQLTLVIDEEKGRARTVEEQIAFVAPPATTRRAERYEIVGDRLRVLAETEFTMTNLEEILNRMKQSALQDLTKKK